MEWLSNFLLSIDAISFLTGLFTALMILIAIVLHYINRNPDHAWTWIQMIQDHDGKGSLSRLLQLAGGVTATFVIVHQTISNNLSEEMFLIYLAAVGVSEAFTKWVQRKYDIKDKEK
jgi:hypothetical protein